ncbi:helix-turn-helix domain-containing protein [Patescibacteria group bacterium]|nr:helix-turn-helix domain-containing protein [Patescibacteria group bacterium]MBU1886083.1 helix-turn-helix domain-containing protein [Patescibacteria group bacterium]
MKMKMSKQKPPADNLYLQIWRNPIFKELLLAQITADQWHTFTALAVFMNKKGECYPSQSKLKQLLGLSSVASSVSRRIASLEKACFEGEPLIKVFRKKKDKVKGKFLFASNGYQLNQNIITIFAPHDTIIIRRQQQLEDLNANKAKLANSLHINASRKDDKQTRRSF